MELRTASMLTSWSVQQQVKPHEILIVSSVKFAGCSKAADATEDSSASEKQILLIIVI